jgi:hypothetical protein
MPCSYGLQAAIATACATEDDGLLDQVDTFFGVTVGGVIALLLISGYKIRDIVSIASQIDLFDMTITDMTNMKTILTKLILNKLGSIPTMIELYMKTGKALIISKYKKQVYYFTPFENEQYNCLDVVLDYKKSDTDITLINPYPIYFFDHHDTNILGCYVTPIYTFPNLKTPSSYVTKLLELAVDQRISDAVKTSSSSCKHIILETTDYQEDPIKNLSTMIIKGYNVGKLFLENINNDNVKPIGYSYPPFYLKQEEL